MDEYKQQENKELKEYFIKLEVGNSAWISSIQSNLYRVTERTFILSLYDVETYKYLSHTTITVI